MRLMRVIERTLEKLDAALAAPEPGRTIRLRNLRTTLDAQYTELTAARIRDAAESDDCVTLKFGEQQ
jgi:hypothetical protein